MLSHLAIDGALYPVPDEQKAFAKVCIAMREYALDVLGVSPRAQHATWAEGVASSTVLMTRSVSTVLFDSNTGELHIDVLVLGRAIPPTSLTYLVSKADIRDAQSTSTVRATGVRRIGRHRAIKPSKH